MAKIFERLLYSIIIAINILTGWYSLKNYGISSPATFGAVLYVVFFTSELFLGDHADPIECVLISDEEEKDV